MALFRSAALAAILAAAAQGVRLMQPTIMAKHEDQHEEEFTRMRVAVHELFPILDDARPLPSLASLRLSMSDLYGDPVCTGNPGFVESTSAAPPGHCRYRSRDYQERGLARHFHKNWVFDNYALERIMLGKWLSSPLRCREGQGPNSCGPGGPDVVVLPSPSLHYFVTKGFNWRVFLDMSFSTHVKYWQKVAESYPRRPGRAAPLFVVHHPFAFHNDQSAFILRSLAKMPAEFASRVVIASLETNLRRNETTATLNSISGWDTEMMLAQGTGRAPTSHAAGAPLLVSLPYPTSILRPASFTAEMGAYRSGRRRPIAVALEVSKKPGAWLRDELILQAQGAKTICSAPTDLPNCGVGAENTFNIAANSAFCIQPPGDTLTRAEFYISVLMGCVPVIFDGGQHHFRPHEPAQWAWRSLAAEEGRSFQQAPPFVNYRDFAVILNASSVRKTDVVGTLLGILRDQPKRYQALREGVDRVAPMMTYAMETCTDNCVDAFSTFQRVLRWALRTRR